MKGHLSTKTAPMTGADFVQEKQLDTIWRLCVFGRTESASELHLTLFGQPLVVGVGAVLAGRSRCAHTVTRCRLALLEHRLRAAGHQISADELVCHCKVDLERRFYRTLVEGYCTGRNGSQRVNPADFTGITAPMRWYFWQLFEQGNAGLAGAMSPGRFRRLVWPLLTDNVDVNEWFTSKTNRARIDAAAHLRVAK